MREEDIPRAKEIAEELKELRYFSKNINNRYGRHTSMFLKRKCDISYSIFGSRDFGVDSHESEVKIPSSVIPEIDAKVLLRIEQLEKELKAL